jgi:hypothetical protein
MGVLGNSKAATNAAAATAYASKETAGRTVGDKMNAPGRTMLDAYKTGGSKGAAKALREYAGRTPKKPFGTL